MGKVVVDDFSKSTRVFTLVLFVIVNDNISYHCISGGIVLQQLLDWVRVHFTEGDQLAKEVVQAEEPDFGENYWSAVSMRL